MASPQTLQARARDQACQTVVCVALERSDQKWTRAFSAGHQSRLSTIPAGARVPLGEAVAKAKARFGMPGVGPIVRCSEAGRAGVWRPRSWVHGGGAQVVVDASRSAVKRRARRAKTDRVDVEHRLRLLLRDPHGAQRVWRVGHGPRVEEAEARRGPRA
jgi:transposase